MISKVVVQSPDNPNISVPTVKSAIRTARGHPRRGERPNESRSGMGRFSKLLIEPFAVKEIVGVEGNDLALLCY